MSNYQHDEWYEDVSDEWQDGEYDYPPVPLWVRFRRIWFRLKTMIRNWRYRDEIPF